MQLVLYIHLLSSSLSWYPSGLEHFIHQAEVLWFKVTSFIFVSSGAKMQEYYVRQRKSESRYERFKMSPQCLNMSQTNCHYDVLFIQCCTGIQNIVTEYVTGRILILEIIHQQNLFNDLFPPFFVTSSDKGGGFSGKAVIVILLTLRDFWYMPEQNGWERRGIKI